MTQLQQYEQRHIKSVPGFLNRSETNRAVQPAEIARHMEFRIQEVEGLQYQCGENECVAFFAYAKCRFTQLQPYKQRHQQV